MRRIIDQKIVHTLCSRHVSGILGRSFRFTTASCISSNDGCAPISSSRGSIYSLVVPQAVHLQK